MNTLQETLTRTRFKLATPTTHISWYTWSLVPSERCRLESWDPTTCSKGCLDPFVFPPILTVPAYLVSFESQTCQLPFWLRTHRTLQPLQLFFSAFLLSRASHTSLLRRRWWFWRHWYPHGCNWFLFSVLKLNFSRASFRHRDLPHILLWDKSCHNVDFVNRVQTTCCRLVLAGWCWVKENSQSQTFHHRRDRWCVCWLCLHHWSLGHCTWWCLIQSHSPCSLCSCAPISIGESICSFWMFCVGSCIGATRLEDDDDDLSCCITAVGCWSSTVIFAIDPTPAPTALELSLSFASTSFLRDCTRQSRSSTAAASRCRSNPHHNFDHQTHTPMSRWILVLTRLNRWLQLICHVVPRRFSNYLQITNQELFLGWRAAQRFRFLNSIFWRNDTHVSLWSLANPDSMAPSLIQIDCWHGSVLVHHSFSEWQLTRVSLSRNTRKCGSPVVLHLKLRQDPHSVTNRPGQRNAVIWQNFTQKIYKVWSSLDLRPKSCSDSDDWSLDHVSPFETSVLNKFQHLLQHRFLAWV